MLKVYKPDSELPLEKQIEAVLTLAKQKNETIFAKFNNIDMIVAPTMTIDMALRLYKRLSMKINVITNEKNKNKVK